MGKEINIYYRIKETGEEFKNKESLYIDSEIGNRYSFEKEKIRKQEEGNFYPIYAVNNGAVSSERITTSDGYRKVRCSGYLSDIETDNNWIIYYSEIDPTVSDVKKQPLKAEMTTNTDYVRIGVSDYPENVDSYIENFETILFDSVTISTGTMSESFFTYGSTFSPSCSITMTTNSSITYGKYIHVEFSIDGVWQSFGTFYVNTPPVMTSEQMTINASGLLDSVLSKKKIVNLLDISEIGSVEQNVITIPFLIERVKRKIGIDIIFDFEDKLKAYNYEDTWYKYSAYVIPCEVVEKKEEEGEPYYTLKIEENKSIREILSIFGVIFHSNIVERNGKIHVVHNSVNDYEKNIELFTESDYSEEPEMRLNAYYCPNEVKVKCTQMKWGEWPGVTHGVPVYMENAEKEVTIMNKSYHGDKSVINYPVDIIEESLWCEATVIRPQYWGNQTWSQYSIREYVQTIGMDEPFIYYPIDIELLGFNPCIYAGSTAKIEVNGAGKYIYVGNLTISWDGMMSMQISSPCDVEMGGNSSGGSNYQNGTSSSAGNGISAGVASSIITGQIFIDGAIEGSKIKDSTITGSKFEDGTITGSKIAESTITGSLIANNTISGNKISENTISGNLIMDNTLTGNLIKDGTITNNLIQDSTLTGAKIHDATIGFEKVDESFITNLTADSAYIKDLTAKVANIGSLTADDAIIKNIQAVAVSAEYIKAATAEIGYITVSEADLKYADITFGNIDTANIDKANIGLLFNEVGLIDRATIVDGHITGFLDAVEINANKITAGTLIAERLLLKGSEDGLLFALNNMGEIVSQNVDTLDGGILTERTVTADKLVAKSITANEIDADKMFSNELVAKIIAANSGEFLELSANQITTGRISSERIDTNSLFVSYSENYATIDEKDENTMFDTEGNVYSEIGSTKIVNGFVQNKNDSIHYIVPFCDLTKNEFFSGGEVVRVKTTYKYISGSGSVGIRAFMYFSDEDGNFYGKSKYYSENSISYGDINVIHDARWEIKLPKWESDKEHKKYVIGVIADKGADGLTKPTVSVSKCEAKKVIYGGLTVGEDSLSSFGDLLANKIDCYSIDVAKIGAGGIVSVDGSMQISNILESKNMQTESIAVDKIHPYSSSGGTIEIDKNSKLITGSVIAMNDGKNTNDVIRLLDDGDSYNYGSELVIGAGGNVFIGSGESAYALRNVIGPSSAEHTHISSDNNIFFEVNCNNIANRLQVVLNNSRNFYPATNNTGSLGTSSNRWGNVYVTKFNNASISSTGTASSSSYGLTKLYTSAGNSTDGAMTRASITNELKTLIKIEYLYLNSITLAGYYDGVSATDLPNKEGYDAMAATPVSSGHNDVCWIQCEIYNGKVYARIKNTTGNNISSRPIVNIVWIKKFS